MHSPRSLPLVFSVILFAQIALHAGTITSIDFDGLNDSDLVTLQFPGLTFANAIVLSSGISLNEFEFPPHSGANVASDNGGSITIVFASPVTGFGGYFTYIEPLALVAFDSSNLQVASTTSAFSSNDALFGDLGSDPNEFIQVAFASGISSVTIAGDPNGGSFVMDDISFTSAVPEPSSLLLLITGALGFLALRRKILR
jgi:hypothetical protein